MSSKLVDELIRLREEEDLILQVEVRITAVKRRILLIIANHAHGEGPTFEQAEDALITSIRFKYPPKPPPPKFPELQAAMTSGRDFVREFQAALVSYHGQIDFKLSFADNLYILQMTAIGLDVTWREHSLRNLYIWAASWWLNHAVPREEERRAKIAATK